MRFLGSLTLGVSMYPFTGQSSSNQPQIPERVEALCISLGNQNTAHITFSVIGSRRTARSSHCLTGWRGVTRTKKAKTPITK